MELGSKSIPVTGGAGGLGRALVKRLAAEGATVAVLDKDRDSLERLREDVRGVECIECDLTDCPQVHAKLDGLFAKLGAIDVLVNNAGVIHSAPLVGFSPHGVQTHDVQAWDRVLAVNLSSVFYVTVKVVARMLSTRTRGVVVNISSVSAAGNPGQGAYSAAKAGVNALTAAWAQELGPMRIRVVGVAPGFTDTPSTRSAMSESTLKHWIDRVPSRRLGCPEEIVAGILSVIENDFMNGKVLELDGGLVI